MSTPTATHVYVVGFSDSIVKVGRTSDFRKRCWALRSAALKRGARITHSLVIESDNAGYAERYLCLAGSALAPRAFGIEYFKADFDQFVPALEARFAQWGKSDLLAGPRTETAPVDKPEPRRRKSPQ